MRFRGSLASMLLLTTACASSPVPTQLRGLFGSWDLVSESGGIAGGTRTASQLGYTLRLSFEHSGQLRVFRNDSLQMQTRYRAFVSRPTVNEPTATELRYAPALFGYDRQNFSLDGDELTLLAECCDGINLKFARRR